MKKSHHYYAHIAEGRTGAEKAWVMSTLQSNSVLVYTFCWAEAGLE